MAARQLRALSLAVFVLLSLFFLLRRGPQRLSQATGAIGTSLHTTLDTTSHAIDPCSSDSDASDPACSKSGFGLSDHSILAIDDVPPTQSEAQKPGPLVYPQGFEQFDTSNPDSPYHSETYDISDESERVSGTSIVNDQEKSYLARLEAWVPYNRKYNIESHNPVIWQTFREEPGINSVPYHSWLEKNAPRWSRTFVPDSARDGLVSALSRDLDFLNETYYRLPSKILKLDFLRYVSLYHDGGVYADVDSSCNAPIEEWYSACYSDSPARNNGRPSRTSRPGLIVGVEFDLSADENHASIGDRQLALANYVFAASKGHPALSKVVANIVTQTLLNATQAQTQMQWHSGFRNVSDEDAVHAWTGRKMWTDTIISHIQESVPGFKESDLLGLKKAKVVDDVCVLPIRAFGSGQSKYTNSPESIVEGVLVKHFMMHGWDL